MSIIDRLLALLAPHSCVGCGLEGSLLCAPCAAKLPPARSRCYRCLSNTQFSVTCSDCKASSYLYACQAATLYKNSAKTLIHNLKYEGAQAAAPVMARCMAPFLPVDDEWLIVPAPTTAARRRTRGYDQALLLADELGRLSRLPVASLLARHGEVHQVGANRSQRLGQLEQAFRVIRPSGVRDRNIILVDDVLTTGATLESAARALKLAGAARIMAVVFAQA